MNIEDSLGDWYPLLKEEMTKPYMQTIGKYLAHDRERLCPVLDSVFRALKLCPPASARVIIIGQDPYPSQLDADGLAFSAAKVTASLQQVFGELKAAGLGLRSNPRLDDWAAQGVLLLNTSLTCVKGITNYHAKIGWDKFVGEVCRIALGICPVTQVDRRWAKVVMLWGGHAKEFAKSKIIDYLEPWHLVLESCHPAAPSYNPGVSFIGNNHFIKANAHLVNNGRPGINWINNG